MTLRVLQLTDLHIVADPDAQLKGVATQATLCNLLAFLEKRADRFDHTMITGDITHDGQRDSYNVARELLGRFALDAHFVPGNHDDRATMRKVFADVLTGDDDEPISFSRSSADWRLIGLDSLDTPHASGRIEDRQLSWLRAELQTFADEPTALFMHHPPVDVNCTWLDTIGLKQRDGFVTLIEQSPQVQVICAGHVHHEFESRIGTAQVLTTPSTGVQFDPAYDEPVVAPLLAGCRIIEFDGNGFHSHVLRMTEPSS